VNGPTHKYAGRVEMYWNTQWRTVCYDGWDEYDAQVVCRQSNYLSTSVQILGMYACTVNIALRIHFKCMYTATSYERDHRNPLQLTSVGCNGSENNLASCCASEISTNVYCRSGLYAGVRCKLHHDCIL
jgi:hypothetical protein